MIISKSFTFEASHILPLHPGKCSRLHGHSWKLKVSVESLIDPASGMVCDFYILSDLVKSLVVDRLDHTHLGYGYASGRSNVATISREWDNYYPYFGPDFYPTSENLSLKIAETLTAPIKDLHLNGHLSLVEITIAETCTSEAIWRPGAL